MKSSTPLVLALACALGAAAVTAIAQQMPSDPPAPGEPGAPPPKGHGRMMGGFMRLDADHDGKISRDEAAKDPKLAAKFDQLDANHDGFLDRSDFEAMRKEHGQKRFAEMDTNHDGKVSKEEMLAAMAKHDAERAKKRGEFVDAMFKRLDTNGDGALSQDELAKAHGPGGDRGPGAWGDRKGQRQHMDMKPATPAQ
ncbi:EF-hand domain-containing protein [Solilutibacter silvestris]|uniref:EF-hand domain-containing protein n=1 Tax=Solilutibacter silvestris TaxID=1645665 RepID=UPI003D34533A